MDQRLRTFLTGVEVELKALALTSLLALAITVLLVLNRERFMPPKPINYFELSGVPRPKPIRNFNVRDAKPRPYRPFRWPYHQTMGTFQLFLDLG